MLDRLSKLALLFFSAGNPVWEHLVETAPKRGDPVPAKKHLIAQQKIANAAKISQSTLGNWKKGGVIDLQTLDEAFGTVITSVDEAPIPVERKRELIASVKGFQVECLDPNSRAPVYDVARQWLSIQMEDCQKILDEIIYDTFTLFPSLSYDSKSGAEPVFKKYGGLYHLYVHRRGRWLKCPLRVRYAVKSGIRHVVRCKLNAPKLRPEPGAAFSYMEYDGFLRTTDENVYWKFEKRDGVSVDFIDFITDDGKLYRTDDDRAVRILSGRYLTIGQDALHSIEDGYVVMEGVLPEQFAGSGYETFSQAGKDAAVVNWMHKTACVLDEGAAEWDRVNRLWKKYGAPSRSREAIKPLGD